MKYIRQEDILIVSLKGKDTPKPRPSISKGTKIREDVHEAISSSDVGSTSDIEGKKLQHGVSIKLRGSDIICLHAMPYANPI